MKISLLIAGLFLTISATSQAGVRGSGFHGGSIGRGARPVAIRGGFNGGGFRGGFVGRRAGAPFRTGQAVRRGFAGRRFFSGNPVGFYQAYGWPGYWDPYDDPFDYSYLEPDTGSDYQYWDNSTPTAQPESPSRQVDQRPVVIVVNNPGNTRPIQPGYNPGYLNGTYIRRDAGEQPGVVVPNGRTDPPPATPVVPSATPAAPDPQTPLQPGPGAFGKFVVVGWLQDGEKTVVSVKNIETNDVQRITSQPNIDHLRLVEIHPNPDLRQFEAIISNGSEQGPVRFRF